MAAASAATAAASRIALPSATMTSQRRTCACRLITEPHIQANTEHSASQLNRISEQSHSAKDSHPQQLQRSAAISLNVGCKAVKNKAHFQLYISQKDLLQRQAADASMCESSSAAVHSTDAMQRWKLEWHRPRQHSAAT
jgi:hypothetical protein